MERSSFYPIPIVWNIRIINDSFTFRYQEKDQKRKTLEILIISCMNAKTQDGMKLKDGFYCKNSFASLSYFFIA